MRIGPRTFDFSRPVIMGILNVTPDSFSDGGEFLDAASAVSHALKMIEEGADIIDIGGESSRPGSEPVDATDELRRVIPVISGIRERSDIPISIDTTKSRVAEEAVRCGAGMINDISAGRFDPKMFATAARLSLPICLMHMRGTPKMMQEGEIKYDDVVGEILTFLSDRVEAATSKGVKRENIIVDPGIGFGKRVEHNITILEQLERFELLELPIMIGTSRKSFIGHILGGAGPKERLEGTLATCGIAVENGANILRVHDVAPLKRYLSLSCRLAS